MKRMTRHGTELNVLPDGHRRRMSDGKNAFKKMNHAQRYEYLRWIGKEAGAQYGIAFQSYICNAADEVEG